MNPRLNRIFGWLLMLLAGLAHAPSARAITIALGPTGLQLSPAGPFSTARDKPVGTVIATANNMITASGISSSCVVTALILSGSSATGNTFNTSVPGLGVNLYYFNGATRVQITPGIQASLGLTLTAPGTITTIQAQLVVTGQVSSGSLTTMPSVNLTFLTVGLGCGVLNLANTTLNVTAAVPAVTALTCLVTTPVMAITLPPVTRTDLNLAGKVAGATRFTIPLNCNGAGAAVFVTLTDALNVANVSGLLSLKPTSTAGNVALQLLKPDNSVISFGPDSALAGTINQFLVGSSASISGIPLIAQYYATGVATAGSVQALATFTMSYQ